MSDIINQNTEPLFIFDMPDDETLSETISVKGEKGERGDPTKLSDLTNDTGFITNSTSGLENYYTKSQTYTKTETNGLLNAKADASSLADYYTKTETDGLINDLDIPNDFFADDETVSGKDTTINLNGTTNAVFGEIRPYGAAEQSGTPSPTSPVFIETATGLQTISITGSNSRSQAYEVNLGKNLFNKDAIVVGKYINASGAEVADDGFAVSDYIEVNPNEKYAYSGSTSQSSYGAKAAWYTADKTWISSVGFDATGTLTAPSNARYFRTSIRYLSGDARTYQFERGATATSYSEYFDPIKLCKLGNYQDYIYKSGDGWYRHKTVGKYTFDGSESWGQSSSTSSTHYVAMIVVGESYFQASYDDRAQSKMDFFAWGANGAALSSTTGFSLINRQGGGDAARHILLSFDIANIPDLASAKAWITANKPTIYYPLVTPTEERITDAELIGQLDRLNSAYSYDNGTAITVTGSLPVVLSIVAYKDNWSGNISGVNNQLEQLQNKKYYDPSNPIYYGADPTGEADSASAINACIRANLGKSIRFTAGVYAVSSPINTPYYSDEQVNIDFGGSTIKATGALPYVLGIGTYNPSTSVSPNRGNYHARASYAIFENFVIDGNGSAVGIYTQHRYWYARVLNGSIFNSIVGIKTGDTTGYSSDLAIDNIYIQCTDYKDTDTAGIRLNGNDNKITNCRIYNAFIGLDIASSANKLINNHVYLYGHMAEKDTQEFQTIYPQTVAVRDSGNENIYDLMYTDTYSTHYKFSGTGKIVRVVNSMFYTNVTGYDDTAFDFTDASPLRSLVIENNRVNLRQAATNNYGIKGGRGYAALLAQNMTLTNNQCEYITEDLLQVDTNKQVAYPYSGAAQMAAGSYYVVGYVPAFASHGVTVKMIGTGTNRQVVRFTLNGNIELTGAVNLGTSGSTYGLGAKIVTLKDGLKYVEISIMRASAGGAVLGVELDQWANLFDLGLIPYGERQTQTSTLKSTTPDVSATFAA